MRRIAAVLLIALSLFLVYFTISEIFGGPGHFIGSTDSDIYHDPNCHYVAKIKPENLIEFNSIREAQNLGYRPCKVCDPRESVSALFVLAGQVLGIFGVVAWIRCGKWARERERTVWDRIFRIIPFILGLLAFLVLFGTPEQYISGFLGVFIGIPIGIIAMWIWGLDLHELL